MTAAPFQSRVAPWMLACFGREASTDRIERSDRLLEEVFELLQSGDYPRERIRALEAYVYGREKGEPAQEVGGVMLTLAAYCQAHDLDMNAAGETELARVWTKIDVIRAKQAAKPVGSALPVALAWPEPEYRWFAGPHEEHCDVLDLATREDEIDQFRGQHGEDVGGYLLEPEARATFERFLRDHDPTCQMPFPNLQPGQAYPDPQIEMHFRWFLSGWLSRKGQ